MAGKKRGSRKGKRSPIFSAPVSLSRLMGERKFRQGISSHTVAEVLQEGAGQDLEARLKIAEKELKKLGFDCIAKFASNKDLTIDSELIVMVPPNRSLDEVVSAVRDHFKIPPGTFPSVGWRFEEVPDNIRNSFPLINVKTGQLSKVAKGSEYQMQSGYLDTQRSIRNIWRTATDKMLQNVHRQGAERPTEFFIRVHWNPFQGEDGKPLKPTRQE